jgi:hypothetical protein
VSAHRPSTSDPLILDGPVFRVHKRNLVKRRTVESIFRARVERSAEVARAVRNSDKDNRRNVGVVRGDRPVRYPGNDGSGLES